MALAHVWAAAPVSEHANLLLAGGALLWILGGTWASVLVLFHGVPFALVVSLWMVVMGILMWRHADAAQNGKPILEREVQMTNNT